MEPKQKVKCAVCGKECANVGAHMRFCKGPEEAPDKEDPGVDIKITPRVKTITLFSASGKEVPEADYFFGGKALPGFEKMCGKPVDREDLVGVFNKVFKPSDDFLFYKILDKEVYIIIVPIKYSTTVGEENDSFEGDFQKHAISFINEGSVNLDTLRSKLERIPIFCKFNDR